MFNMKKRSPSSVTPLTAAVHLYFSLENQRTGGTVLEFLFFFFPLVPVYIFFKTVFAIKLLAAQASQLVRRNKPYTKTWQLVHLPTILSTQNN